MKQRKIKLIVEKHEDGYVAYPLGVRAIILGEGDTFDEALEDVKSAIREHVEVYGREALEIGEEAIEVFVADATIAV